MRETKVTSYIEYDSERDRSEEFGWKKIKDETVPSEAEQQVWATYTLWSVVVFCVVTVFVFMDKPLW